LYIVFHNSANGRFIPQTVLHKLVNYIFVVGAETVDVVFSSIGMIKVLWVSE